jgi:glycosyltransferase involved in cell wall biosynthesis
VARVLWLTPDKPENISVGRERIADHLRAAGHDVTIRGVTARTALASLREAYEFDVVVGTTRAGAIAGAAMRVATVCPLVVDHVDPIRQFRETNGPVAAAVVQVLEDASFLLAAESLYVYPEERGRVERWSRRTTRTDLGVEYDRFADPSGAAVATARESLQTAGDGPTAIYVGGLEPMYNIGTLLDAMERLPNWNLIIVGDGSQRNTVSRRAAESANVEFLGTVPHDAVPGYLSLADVGVCLVDDAHTLKVLEYGAAGLGVVQLDGDARERFGDRVRYVRLNPDAVATAIPEAAESDREPLRAFAAKHDWSRIAEQYAEAIKRVK